MIVTTKWQFIAFLMVGGLNALFGYSVYAIAVYLGAHFTLATLIATCLGVLFNFKSTGSIVFKNANNKLLYKFIAVYAFLYLFTVITIKYMHSMSIDLYTAGFVASVLSALLGFILNKYLVFKVIHEAH